MVAIYGANLSSFPSGLAVFGLDAGSTADLFAYVCALGAALGAAAASLRFAFASVSLEGRARWLIAQSPAPADAVLFGKLAAALPWPLLLSGGMGATAGWALHARLPMLVWIAAWVGSTALWSAGLGIAIGAIWPAYDADTPARAAMRGGGLVCALLTMLSVLILALLGAPIAWLVGTRRVVSDPALETLIALAAGLVLVVSVFFATRLVVRIAAGIWAERDWA
jgi:ABC-2 type transport system permease protein